MNDLSHADVLAATRLTRAGRLAEATALLQGMLRGGKPPEAASASGGEAPAAPRERVARINAIEITDPPASRTGPASGTGAAARSAGGPPGTAGAQMPQALRSLLDRIGTERGIDGRAGRSPAHTPDLVPEGGRFLAASYGNQAGSRAFKLYIPSGYRGDAVPLLVMLHGCTQSPDDFAAGTRMNLVAEEHTCLVAYPAQAASANASKCWNWFSPGDQLRGQGEPSLIAGITRQVMRDYAVDPERVYVAGLSAGAAAAAVMGATYPDLFAAIGVHSGLACGAASDLPSAFVAMNQGGAPGLGSAASRSSVPTIVFHGDQDSTVHPRNGDHVIAQSTMAATRLHTTVQRGRVPGGHAYSRTLHDDACGRTMVEQWVIHGAGHAWSGGSPAGSYTDACGPDATREMLRFFLGHRRAEAARPVSSG